MKKSELIWALCEVDDDLVLMAKEGTCMKKTRKPYRFVLIAAMVALFTITAAAVGYSMYADARNDLGISASEVISEYTEYEIEEPTAVSQQVNIPADEETGMISGGETQLVSTFCSGNELIAYISVPNVTKEMAQGPENWDITDTEGTYIDSYQPVKQVSFDETTQCALVKASVSGDFSDVESVRFRVVYREWYAETFTLYDVLEIPVTKSDCLRIEVNRTIGCTEVPFDAAITEAAVYAGYVSLYLQTPSFEELRDMLGEDADEILWRLHYGEEPMESEHLDSCYDGLIDRMMNAYETDPFGDQLDVSLNLADGTSIVLSQQERIYANVWTNPASTYTEYHETGLWEFQCVLSEPLNLADIISITICGDTYEFSAK